MRVRVGAWAGLVLCGAATCALTSAWLTGSPVERLLTSGAPSAPAPVLPARVLVLVAVGLCAAAVAGWRRTPRLLAAAVAVLGLLVTALVWGRDPATAPTAALCAGVLLAVSVRVPRLLRASRVGRRAALAGWVHQPPAGPELSTALGVGRAVSTQRTGDLPRPGELWAARVLHEDGSRREAMVLVVAVDSSQAAVQVAVLDTTSPLLGEGWEQVPCGPGFLVMDAGSVPMVADRVVLDLARLPLLGTEDLLGRRGRDVQLLDLVLDRVQQH